MNTEKKILISATKIFLLFGFHATSIQRIASDAKVSKSVIYYYYRSKEKLYDIIVKEIGKEIIGNSDTKKLSIILFVINELRNNKCFFINSLSQHYRIEWENILQQFVLESCDENNKAQILSEIFK